MITDCETCDRRNVPCSGCEESQRTICFICQGDIADPYCELEEPSLTIISGSPEVIGFLLCGPQQHNEHCKGWRWHLYMQDSNKRTAAVREAALQIIARNRVAEVYLQAAE